MNLLRPLGALILVAGLLSSQATAQRDYKYWAIGLNAGTMHYQGDLDDHGFQPWIGLDDERNAEWGNPFDLVRPSVGVFAEYHLHPHLFLNFQFQFGVIAAADSEATESGSGRFRRFRNLDFKNRIFELSTTANYYFFGNDRHFRYRPKWNPFVFAGVGVFYHSPFTQLTAREIQAHSNARPNLANTLQAFEGENIHLHDLRTEAQGSGEPRTEDDIYSRVQLSIPMGLGIDYKLTDRINIGFKVGFRKTLTDHLDDVGSVFYADPEAFLDGRAATDNAVLSFVLSDRSGYRFRTDQNGNLTVGNNSGFRVQQFVIDQAGNIEGDVGTPGEKRGFDDQDDWFAFTGFKFTYILQSGGLRCPKF